MKTVMITGCNGGIGKASVRKFLSEGWHVVGTTSDLEPNTAVAHGGIYG